MRGRGRRHFGVTLLEIMVALAVMSVVLIAFASVFPAGLRLNLSTSNQSRAASFATSVAEQLANQPVSVLRPLEGATLDSILNSTVPYSTVGQMVLVLPSGLYSKVPPSNPNAFLLSNVTLTNMDPATFPTPPVFSQLSTAAGVEKAISVEQIVVTVSWKETRKSSRTILTKSVTVTALTNSVMSL